MSTIEYYECDNCGDKFSDINWKAAWCEYCDGKFCCQECKQIKNEEKWPTCCKCRMEVARDEDLLNFLLSHFKLTRKQALELYRHGK